MEIESVVTDWGIRTVENGEVVYRSFGSYDEAVAAREAWDKDVSSSRPQLVSRQVTYSEWELL